MTGLSLGRPRFVVTEEALAWHETAIAQFGGSAGVRDRGLLESALAQARQGFSGEFANPFPFGMAAAYAYHVALNHPFVDGNKRVALLCCGAFLRMNGWNLTSQSTDAADAVLKLIEGTLDKQGFAVWLESHCAPRVSFELRDFFAMLGPEQHYSHLQAVTAKKDLEGLLATIGEAGDAIPLIQHLVKRALQLEAEGKQDQSRMFASMYALLVSIFRVAEDMGYEW